MQVWSGPERLETLHNPGRARISLQEGIRRKAPWPDMKLKGKVRIAGDDIWVLLFVAGVVAGTVAANRVSEEARSQAGYFARFLTSDYLLSDEKKARLWHMVLGQRFFEMGVAALASQTAFAAPLFCLFGCLGGFASAVILSVLTFQNGVWGLPVYLISWLPHGILYILVWKVLISAAMDSHTVNSYGRVRGLVRNQRFGAAQWLFLGLLVFGGSCLEAYAGPYMFYFVGKIISH